MDIVCDDNIPARVMYYFHTLVKTHMGISYSHIKYCIVQSFLEDSSAETKSNQDTRYRRQEDKKSPVRAQISLDRRKHALKQRVEDDMTAR
jgi:hypothetical protein